MEIIILGSGTYQPERERLSSSYLVKVGGQNLIFDFGRGTLGQLLKVGINYYDIDAVFITHTHADHCSELSSFLHIALAEPENGRFREKDITVYVPERAKKAIAHILKAFSLEKFKPRYKVKIRELTNGSIVKGQGWTVKNYEARHSQTIECLSYRLEAEGKAFAYSGDTEDCSGLRESCKDADLAIIEASWPEELESKGHMSGETAGRIAGEAKVKKLVLSHITPYYLENFDIKSEAKSFCKCPVFIAKDLMRIKIGNYP
jgi:ribonuclease BN (tRNA processing enzyme)